MKEFISWCALAVILLSICLGAIFAGAFVANFLQEILPLPGAWCLLYIAPFLLSAVGIEMFFLMGIKKLAGRM